MPPVLIALTTATSNQQEKIRLRLTNHYLALLKHVENINQRELKSQTA